jgi:uncharacterized cofD-like protein
MKRIVTIGGGSGQYVLLSALRDVEDIEITSIVSMADSGGSTGRLRDELGVLPPGDVLKCLLALSPNREVFRPLLLRRFERSEKLSGHNAGNMLLTMLSQYAGDFYDGVASLGEILECRGKVIPVTTNKITLIAKLINGEEVIGEAAVDVPEENRPKIEDVYLSSDDAEKIEVNARALKSIEKADYVIVGPGDFYTSIVPNLLVPGLCETLQKSKAKILYILNIMTKHGETDDWMAKDFVLRLEKYLGRKINVLIANSMLVHLRKLLINMNQNQLN